MSTEPGVKLYEMLSLKAEDIKPNVLDMVPVDMYPTRDAYASIMEGVEKLSKGYTISWPWISIIGYYGSGKTFVLRKAAHDAVNKYENIIPIYFYLGEKNAINLFTSLGKYIEEIRRYVESSGNYVSPKIVGHVEAWRKKIEVLSSTYSEVQKAMSGEKSEILKFAEAMKQLNSKGYIPLIILDEFERLIRTGEGFEDEQSYTSFVEFSKYSLEMSRGHLFRSVTVLGLTKSINELLEEVEKRKEQKEEKEPLPPYVRKIEDKFGRPFSALDIGSESVTSAMKTYKLQWDSLALEQLCKSIGITLPLDIVRMIGNTLPTPRAVLQIYSRLSKERGEKAGFVEQKMIYEIIRPRWESLRARLLTEKLDNRRPLIMGQARWDEQFEKLLSNGIFVINFRDSGLLSKVAEALGLPTGDERALRTKVRNLANNLSNYGLLERVDKNTYAVSKQLFAYFLDIERLPGGELATLKAVVDSLKDHIKAVREGRKKYKAKKEESEKELGE